MGCTGFSECVHIVRFQQPHPPLYSSSEAKTNRSRKSYSVNGLLVEFAIYMRFRIRSHIGNKNSRRLYQALCTKVQNISCQARSMMSRDKCQKECLKVTILRDRLLSNPVVEDLPSMLCSYFILPIKGKI